MQQVDSTLRDELERAVEDTASLALIASQHLRHAAALISALREVVDVMTPDQLATLTERTCDTIATIREPITLDAQQHA